MNLKRLHGHLLSIEPDKSLNLVVLLALFALAWLGHLTSVSLSAPADNIEQWVWSHSAQWGYYKHPPLPTWLLISLLHFFGGDLQTTYILGAAITLTCMGLLYSTVHAVWDGPSALVSVLAALSITFYNGRLDYYNHNTLLMLTLSASIFCWWKIFENGQLRWWLGLGVSAGLGMLSKYQYAIFLLPSVYCLIELRVWKDPKALRGAALSLCVAAAVFLPHVVWLITGDGNKNPIGYALSTARPNWMPLPSQAGAAPKMQSGLWLVDLLFNRCLPAIALIGFLCLWHRFDQRCSARRADTRRAEGVMSRRSLDRGDRFLLAWSVMPSVTVTLLGQVLGLDLQMQWGTSFALWMVPGLVWAFNVRPQIMSRHGQWWPIYLFIGIQGLLLLHSYQTSAFGCCTTQKRWRTVDTRTIAAELNEAARATAGGRLTIISGPAPVAGALSLALPDRPQVLIEGDEKISPWIRPEQLKQPGIVEVFPPEARPSGAQVLPSGWAWRLYDPTSREDSVHARIASEPGEKR